MINIIGKQLNKKLLILFISINQFSIICLAQNAAVIDTFEGYIHMEICRSNQFSFCSDGIGQPYRVIPTFVYLNEDDFEKSYTGNVFFFTVDSKLELDDFAKSFEEYDFVDIRNYLLNRSIQNNDTISINLGFSFKHKINKIYRKTGIKKKFNGKLYYAGLYLKFTAVEIISNDKEIWLPNVKSNKLIMKTVNAKRKYCIQKFFFVG